MTTSKERFAKTALQFPLFIGDPTLMAQKLNGAGGLLKEYWADFHATHLTDPKTRSEMIFLPALLDERFVKEARENLKAYYTTLPKTDTAGDFQFHTWCRCGTVTRRAAFFDWLAYRGEWSQDEIEEAAECFLGYGFKHAFHVLTSRTRASNNQALSMALYCAVVGFLFGYKLANHPTGRFLFDYGTGRLPDLIGLFPADGYGGEGSTYTSHVNTPLSFWTCEFLRQITGRDYLDKPFKPNGTTLRKMLEIELRITGPGGLLAPWDHYGWQKAVNGSAYAYLARVTGKPDYLSLIPALYLWASPGYLAWGADDPMWTLIWWPEKAVAYDKRELPAKLFGWFLPRTGAALDDCPHRLRLMQVWDASAGTVAGIGRAQANPNHLMLDYQGEPVFQDGIQDGDRDPFGYPPEKIFAALSQEERDRYMAYIGQFADGSMSLYKLALGLAPGMVGAANVVVIDNEPWHWPGVARIGKPEFYASKGGMQVVTADSSPFYQPRYDVSLARRTSIWLKDGFGIVLDDLRAARAHQWQWQAYLRPDVHVHGQTARVKLPSGRSVLLAWDAGCVVRTQMVDGFPRTEEKRSIRIELTRSGAAAQFAMVIAPEAKTASIRRSGAHLLEVEIDGKKHQLVVENFSGQASTIAAETSSAAFAWKAPRRRLLEIQSFGRGVHTNAPKPDVHELEDITVERDLQYPQFERLVKFDATPVQPGGTRLSQIDACLAQLAAAQPDAPALIAALQSPHWPVQTAAAEVLGRRGCTQAVPLIRELLKAEHAKPSDEIYPPLTAPAGPRTSEDLGKRWRLKTALIIALGRLGDVDSVPLLGRIIADNRDFYPVYSTAAQAIGRLGGPHAKDALAAALKDNEHNTHVRAWAALAAIERHQNV